MFMFIFCTECDTENFYVLENGFCRQVYIRGCHQINRDGKCIKCKEDYIMIHGNRCTEIVHYGPGYPDPEIENCNYYLPEFHECYKCHEGFVYDKYDNKCVRILHCRVYDDEFTCAECFEHFMLTPDYKKCYYKIPKCDDYDDEFENCEECIEPFIRYKGKCVIHGCEEHEYENDSDESSYNCDDCYDGLERSPDGLYCYHEIEDCIDYTDDFRECEECGIGYGPKKDERGRTICYENHCM